MSCLHSSKPLPLWLYVRRSTFTSRNQYSGMVNTSISVYKCLLMNECREVVACSAGHDQTPTKPPFLVSTTLGTPLRTMATDFSVPVGLLSGSGHRPHTHSFVANRAKMEFDVTGDAADSSHNAFCNSSTFSFP